MSCRPRPVAAAGAAEMTTALVAHPLIARLLALHLPADDHAVFGSGPLLAHGLTATANDIDVVARGAAWRRATRLRRPVRAPSGIGQMVELDDGKLQIFDTWIDPEWDVDGLIDGAEVIAGIRFVPLAVVLMWKRREGRPKDRDHIRLIEEYLATGRPSQNSAL
jgi:hypothetical protein